MRPGKGESRAPQLTLGTLGAMSLTVMTATARLSLSTADRSRDVAPAAESGTAANHMGPLADADLAKELAQLTALLKRQAIGAESLVGPNRAPQTLLSLFNQA